MSKVRTFTSTGKKLLHHTEAVELFKRDRLGTPISLQVGPTSRCNLKCKFCSNVNRKKHQDLDTYQLQNVILKLLAFGLKTVEWTGGGDPTLYKGINEMIVFCNKCDLEQGMITNGVELNKIDTFEHLKWLRISMNCLEYVDDIEIPDLPHLTMGFSFVHDNPRPEVLRKLDKYVTKFKPTYVRIVPNCQATDEEQNRNNEIIGSMVEGWGEPYFYQPKMFNRPDECFWCYFKPFLLHDGWVYPCSSVVLNENAGRSFHNKYRWVRMEKLPSMYESRALPCPTNHCDHCVFYDQNADLASLAHPTGMENFV
jgi:MoaA/NifB/PqqE/SkfB family radical SAM enzyme